MPIRRNAVPVASRASSARAGLEQPVRQHGRAGQPRRARADGEVRGLQLQHHAAGATVRAPSAGAPASRPVARDARSRSAGRVRSVSNVVSALIDLVSRRGIDLAHVLAARAAASAGRPRPAAQRLAVAQRLQMAEQRDAARPAAGPAPGRRRAAGAPARAPAAPPPPPRRSPRSRAACRGRRRSWPAAGWRPGRSRRSRRPRSTSRAKRASTTAGGAPCSASVPARSSTASSIDSGCSSGVSLAIMRADLPPDRDVFGEVRADHHRVGAGLQRLEHRHGAAHAVDPRDVAGGGDHAAHAAADDHRLAASSGRSRFSTLA